MSTANVFSQVARRIGDQLPIELANMLGGSMATLRNGRNGDQQHKLLMRLINAPHREFPSTTGNVLVVPYRHGNTTTWIEIVLAYMFRWRGFNPVLLFCDQAVSYCDHFVVTHSRQVACSMCRAESLKTAAYAGLKAELISSLVSEEVLKRLRTFASDVPVSEVADYEFNGVALGAQVMASLYRHLLRVTIDLEQHESLLREYLFTALVSSICADLLIEQYKPEHVLISHGIYSTFGAFSETCRARDVPVVTWGRHYRKNSLLFAHSVTYHKALIEESSDIWKSVQLTEDEKREIVSYYNAKIDGTDDYVTYYGDRARSSNRLKDTLELNDSRTVFGMFPNLCWDAQLHFSSLVFRTMKEWVVETVRYFATRTDAVLIIRAHPAEKRGAYQTQETVKDILTDNFQTLPENIRFIDSDSTISSYDLVSLVDAGLVYGTKFGLELAVKSIPVFVAGESYYKNKGITYDAVDSQHYFRLLDAFPTTLNMTDQMHERAVRFAHYYNFRRISSFPVARCDGPILKEFKIDSLDALRPGAMQELDSIMHSILNRTAFGT